MNMNFIDLFRKNKITLEFIPSCQYQALPPFNPICYWEIPYAKFWLEPSYQDFYLNLYLQRGIVKTVLRIFCACAVAGVRAQVKHTAPAPFSKCIKTSFNPCTMMSRYNINTEDFFEWYSKRAQRFTNTWFILQLYYLANIAISQWNDDLSLINIIFFTA